VRRRPIVVTFVTLSACAGVGNGGSPETPPRDPPPPRVPELVPAREGVLNPADRVHGTIYRGAQETCYVHVPFATPPTSVQAPPTETVVCPPVLLDPSWEACLRGEVTVTDAVCSCFVHGNPPSQVPIACPKHG
jgi:hypothetical protein